MKVIKNNLLCPMEMFTFSCNCQQRLQAIIVNMEQRQYGNSVPITKLNDGYGKLCVRRKVPRKKYRRIKNKV